MKNVNRDEARHDAGCIVLNCPRVQVSFKMSVHGLQNFPILSSSVLIGFTLLTSHLILLCTIHWSQLNN